MSVSRRLLLTASAAAALLCALWFVPSANADEEPGGTGQQPTVSAPAWSSGPSGPPRLLAGTGGVDNTP